MPPCSPIGGRAGGAKTERLRITGAFGFPIAPTGGSCLGTRAPGNDCIGAVCPSGVGEVWPKALCP